MRLLIGVLAGVLFLPAVTAAGACEDWIATVVSVQVASEAEPPGKRSGVRSPRAAVTAWAT